MRTVDSTECVIDINVAQRCQLCSKLRIILFFTGMESEILKENKLTFLCVHDRFTGNLANTIVGKVDSSLEKCLEMMSNRSE
jgi:hypothetical protein